MLLDILDFDLIGEKWKHKMEYLGQSIGEHLGKSKIKYLGKSQM